MTRVKKWSNGWFETSATPQTTNEPSDEAPCEHLETVIETNPQGTQFEICATCGKTIHIL